MDNSIPGTQSGDSSNANVAMDHDDGLRVKKLENSGVLARKGKRKDLPELFYPRGFTSLWDGFESRPCPMYFIKEFEHPPDGRAPLQVLN